MAVSLQVIYPTDNGTTFNHKYYMKKYVELISSGMRKHWESLQVTKGMSGAGDTPAASHAIATIIHKD